MMYNKSQSNLKGWLRKLNDQQQTRLLATCQERDIHKINPKKISRGFISSK